MFITPKISIIIPTYNAGKYLSPAVESVLAIKKTAMDVELIVVDDGSTDGSTSGLEHLPLTLSTQKNKGIAAARNAGINCARGDYLTFLDADDLLIQEGLIKRIDYLNLHSEVQVVTGQPGSIIDHLGHILSDVHEKILGLKKPPFDLTYQMYKDGLFYPVSCATFLYRREVFGKVGNFESRWKVGEDFDFLLRLLKNFPIPVISAACFQRRIHSNNISIQSRGNGKLKFKHPISNMLKLVYDHHGIAYTKMDPWESSFLG